MASAATASLLLLVLQASAAEPAAPSVVPEPTVPRDAMPTSPAEDSVVPEPSEPSTPAQPIEPSAGTSPVIEDEEPTTEGIPPVPVPVPVPEGTSPTTESPDQGLGPSDGDVEPADEDDPFGDDADADDPFGEQDDGGPGTDDAPMPDYDPRIDSPQALRARRWIRTGIGTASAGGALLVGAIIMGASDPCTRAAGNSCQVEARNRAALVMGIPAAMLIGGGAAMIGVGSFRRRALAIDLQASRSSFGIEVRGRF
ncbi:ICP22 family protein [Paraliomyxa miuraensis]|uniref:hypothetical protein n=1 Tax=Paraliomyxa miuraensis TaxID=376150 RepID=UPI00224CB42E|nr:hypothetical protein [Paraliomyxa miuraensis]MCX4245835.1 hypothetical protein [Paraliomyxa miuraensis]